VEKPPYSARPSRRPQHDQLARKSLKAFPGDSHLCSVMSPRTFLTPYPVPVVNGGMLTLIVKALPVSACGLVENAYG
jgi:hypothetical protein